MNSNASIVARGYRLKQWAQQIQECQNRAPGISVNEWCSQHGVTKANYYYRLKQVRMACLETLSPDAMPQSIVRVPSERMGSASSFASDYQLEVSLNHVRIQVTTQTPPDLLRMVLQVAADVK